MSPSGSKDGSQGRESSEYDFENEKPAGYTQEEKAVLKRQDNFMSYQIQRMIRRKFMQNNQKYKTKQDIKDRLPAHAKTQRERTLYANNEEQ